MVRNGKRIWKRTYIESKMDEEVFERKSNAPGSLADARSPAGAPARLTQTELKQRRQRHPTLWVSPSQPVDPRNGYTNALEETKMKNTEMVILYARYMKRIYQKNTIVRIRKVAKYNFEGNITAAVHHVEDDGTVVAYTCYGEEWILSLGDAFCHYIPRIRSARH